MPVSVQIIIYNFVHYIYISTTVMHTVHIEISDNVHTHLSNQSWSEGTVNLEQAFTVMADFYFGDWLLTSVARHVFHNKIVVMYTFTSVASRLLHQQQGTKGSCVVEFILSNAVHENKFKQNI